MGFLYKLTSPSGKSYIGITSKSADSRWYKHLEHARGRREGAVYAAIRKYGAESFIRTVLACDDDWSRLCQREQDAIVEHNTLTPHGYNMSIGGEGVLGPRTEEVKQRISVAQKKRFQRPEERERMRAYARLAKESPKWKASCIARRKQKAPLLTREERSERIRAALRRPEVKAKVSAMAKARASSATWREKVAASKRGRKTGPCSERRKQLIAEARRRREWADPVIRVKRLAALAVARAALAASR